jgi:uncharacterized membrane protein
MKSFLCAVLPLALCAGAVATAGEPAAEPATSQSEMRTGFDRNTGRFREPTTRELPTPAQQAADRRSAAAALRSAGIDHPETEAEALQTARLHADGSVSMDVPLSLLSTVVAERGPDGHIVIRHDDGHGHHTSPEAASHEEAFPHE